MRIQTGIAINTFQCWITFVGWVLLPTAFGFVLSNTVRNDTHPAF
jgi:hypothetical protein